jgi:hypothetical protein
MPWYHERGHRRGAGRRRGLVIPPVIYPPPDPGDPPDPPPATTLVPGWPFPACTSAWNIAMNSSTKRAAFRLACPKAGTLSKIWLHLKCGASSSAVGGGSGAGYGAGDTGLMQGFIYSVGADGKPSTLLYTDAAFRPGWYAAQSGTLDRDNENSVYIDAGGLVVTEDQLIIVAWRNAHASPASNFFSINALHNDDGPWDAFAANNMAIDYPFATNGFDPRTNTLWSSDGGSSWTVPGSFGYGGQWNPAYALEYDDGSIYGQGTYYGGTSSNTSEVQTIKKCGTHTFTHLATGNPNGGSSSTPIVIKKNGATIHTISGFPAAAGVNRDELPSSISVIDSDVLTVEYNASSRGISNAVCDGVWDELLGLDTTHPIYPENVDHRSALYLEPIPTAWKLLF